MTLVWSAIAVLGYLLTLLLIPLVLLTKKRQPTSSVAWILAILMVPILGGLMFLIFGINRIDRRVALKEQAREHIVDSLPEWTRFRMDDQKALTDMQRNLMSVSLAVSDMRPTRGNSVELLADTNRTLGLIEQAIRSAKHSLHLEYYIWQPDKTGIRVRDLLIAKAKEGVTVRFLYDGLGSFWLNWRFFKPMVDAGIHVATFLPGSGFRQRWSINLRSHRKIVIVDGVVGFTGGMNIGDEYLGKNPYFGFWRDTHLRLVGATVLQLQRVFVEDWYFATGEELTQDELFPLPPEVDDVVADAVDVSDAKHVGRETIEQILGKHKPAAVDHGVAAQVVSGGPLADIRAFHTLMFAAITAAEERITLATSYFVPTPSLVTALETAAYRGVQVRLLVAGRSAYIWTVIAGRSYYDSLLAAGAEIYEYQTGLLHSKTLTVDGSWSLVGTPNFDARSLLLNFEVGVLLYDMRVADRLEHHFEIDCLQARRITISEWEQRPITHVIAENVCRLFAPVL